MNRVVFREGKQVLIAYDISGCKKSLGLKVIELESFLVVSYAKIDIFDSSKLKFGFL